MPATAVQNSHPSHDATASPDRLISLHEVGRQCGMGKTAVYDAIRAGAFPAPVKLGASSRWLQSEIQRFIAEKAAARAA